MKSMRCPGCKNPIAVKDEKHASLTCPTCGKKLRFGPSKATESAPAKESGSSPPPKKPGAKSPATITAKKKVDDKELASAITARPKSTKSPPAKDDRDEAKSPKSNRKARRREDDENYDDKPRKKKKQRTSPWYWAGLAAASLIVIVAIGTLVMTLRSRSRPVDSKVQNQEVAQVPTKPRVAPPTTPAAEPKVFKELEDDDDEKLVKPAQKGVPDPNKRPIIQKVQLPDEAPPPDNPMSIVANNLGFQVPEFDLATYKKEQAVRLEHERLTSVEAYDKVGNKNPKWDDKAKEALGYWAEILCEMHVGPQAKAFKHVRAIAQSAVDAGCDDPFVRYVLARAILFESPSPLPEKLCDDAMQDYLTMAKSKYPASRRVNGFLRAAYLLNRDDASPDQLRLAEELIEQMLDASAKSVKHESKVINLRHNLFSSLNDGTRIIVRTRGGIPKAIEWIDASAKKYPELRSILLTIRGDYLISLAWKARGNGPASTVSEEGWKIFHEHLAVAKGNYAEAWRHNPKNAHASAEMILVCKAIGRGEVTDAQLWFARAMAADPSSYDACLHLLDYLDARWHGSVEAAVGFGRACLRSKNWPSKIPLLVADAHWSTVAYNPELHHRYMHTDAVWNDIKSAFEEYFANGPDSPELHGKYGVMCFICGKYKLAAEHLRQAPEQFYVPNVTPEQIRDLRAEVFQSFPKDK